MVREFLEFFNLEYTLAVFDPETNIVRGHPGMQYFPLLSLCLIRGGCVVKMITRKPFAALSLH